MPNTFRPLIKVLVVSNQGKTGSGWVTNLQQGQQLAVVLETVPANAVIRWEAEYPDLVVLDVSLPKSQIFKLVGELRAQTVVPILLLTTSQSEEFMLEAYESGADDCIPKSSSPALLNAKIIIWLQRSASVPASALGTVKIGNFSLVASNRTITIGDHPPVRLSNLEFRLLYVLMNQPGQTVTIEELNQRVWGYSYETDITMIKNVVYRLRRKIEKDPAHPQIIQYVAGVGYKFVHE